MCCNNFINQKNVFWLLSVVLSIISYHDCFFIVHIPCFRSTHRTTRSVARETTLHHRRHIKGQLHVAAVEPTIECHVVPERQTSKSANNTFIKAAVLYKEQCWWYIRRKNLITITQNNKVEIKNCAHKTNCVPDKNFKLADCFLKSFIFVELGHLLLRLLI